MKERKFKSKTWLGKRLTKTEDDGCWAFTSKAEEPLVLLILQQLSDGRWQAFVRMGSIHIHTNVHKKEWEAMGEAERRLLWYQMQLGRSLKRGRYTRPIPPLLRTRTEVHDY